MKRKLIIDGNAVYEIDEDCKLGKQLTEEKRDSKEKKQEYHNRQEK